MTEKKPVAIKDFLEGVNKKDKKRNGHKIAYAWTNRKRK